MSAINEVRGKFFGSVLQSQPLSGEVNRGCICRETVISHWE